MIKKGDDQGRRQPAERLGDGASNLGVVRILVEIVAGQEARAYPHPHQQRIVVSDRDVATLRRGAVLDEQDLARLPAAVEDDDGGGLDEHLAPDRLDDLRHDLVQVQHRRQRVADRADGALVVVTFPEEDGVHRLLHPSAHGVEEEDHQHREDQRRGRLATFTEERAQEDVPDERLRGEVRDGDESRHQAVADGAFDVHVDVEEVVTRDRVGDAGGEDGDGNGQEIVLDGETEPVGPEQRQIGGERRQRERQRGAEQHDLGALPGQDRGTAEVGLERGRQDHEGADEAVEPHHLIDGEEARLGIQEFQAHGEGDGDDVRRHLEDGTALDELAPHREHEREMHEGGGPERVHQQIDPDEAGVRRLDVERRDREQAERDAGHEERPAHLRVGLEQEDHEADHEVDQARHVRHAERHHEVVPPEPHGRDDDVAALCFALDGVGDRRARGHAMSDGLEVPHRRDRLAVGAHDLVRPPQTRRAARPVILPDVAQDETLVHEEAGERLIHPGQGLHDGNGADEHDAGQDRREDEATGHVRGRQRGQVPDGHDGRSAYARRYPRRSPKRCSKDLAQHAAMLQEGCRPEWPVRGRGSRAAPIEPSLGSRLR